jgi:hypothetical protein
MALMRSMLYTELQLVAVRQSVRSSGGPAEKVVKQMAYFNAGGVSESGAIRAKGAGRRRGARVLTQGLCALALCSGVLLSVVTGTSAATSGSTAEAAHQAAAHGNGAQTNGANIPPLGPGLSVTDLDNGATTNGLAQALVGTGLTVSNVTYTGANRAAGTFTGGTGIIGFDSGIVLDSGAVQTYSTDPACSRGVEGPNNCYEATGGNPGGPDGGDNSTDFGLPGDADLSGLDGVPTFDASVLQFDFVPSFSTVQFSYVFSSEEYSDFANTEFNDVFGFFVNGTNCALVPGTNDPVDVNSINDGNDAGGDTTPHNPQFFVNNVPPTLNTQMDGLTTVLTCSADVNPGVTNHMKLAIADGSDAVLDSAVFLQGQSLVSGTGITTSLSGGGQSGPTISVPLNTAVSDTATLSGANSASATGTVDYKVFSDSSCANLVSDEGTVTVNGQSVPASNAATISAPGTYFWQAAYSGDSLNNPVTSPCGTEVETVTSPINPTTVTTSLSGGGQSGGTISVLPSTAVTDSATLTGATASTATGTVTYNVFSDAACGTAVVTGSPETITTPGTLPDSPAQSFATPGKYYWQAAYSGDPANSPSTSTCGSEIETVKSTPTCTLSAVNVGPPSQVVYTAQDPVDGLSSVVPIRDQNVTPAVSGFSPGTTGIVTVTFTKKIEFNGGESGILAINTQGRRVKCLGQFKTMAPRRTDTEGFTYRERFSNLVIQNGSPGLTAARLTLNGGTPDTIGLTPGELSTESLVGLKPNRLVAQGIGVTKPHAVLVVWGHPLF